MTLSISSQNLLLTLQIHACQLSSRGSSPRSKNYVVCSRIGRTPSAAGKTGVQTDECFNTPEYQISCIYKVEYPRSSISSSPLKSRVSHKNRLLCLHKSPMPTISASLEPLRKYSQSSYSVIQMERAHVSLARSITHLTPLVS